MAKKEVSEKSTKKELWDAYSESLKKVESKNKQILNPEKVIEQKELFETVKEADKIVSGGISGQISALKSEIIKSLNSLDLDFGSKTKEYEKLIEAVKIREQHLKELYDIEKSAGTLAALLDANKAKEIELEEEISQEKEKFDEEMKEAKKAWEKEKKEHDTLIKERDALEEKAKQRAKEEYQYNFEREKQQALNKLKDEKESVQKEIAALKEEHSKETAETEKELEERTAALELRENHISELEDKVAGFTKELETAVNKAVKETTDRLNAENKAQIALLNKEYEGKINLLNSKIENLTTLSEEQKAQIQKNNESLSAAYEKIQNIAVKTVEGATNYKFGQEMVKQQGDKSNLSGK